MSVAEGAVPRRRLRLNQCLVIVPVWDPVRALWTWTDGTVFYEARTRGRLAYNVGDGEGRPVRLIRQKYNRPKIGAKASYKEFHPSHDAVLDRWATRTVTRRALGDELGLTIDQIHRIIVRARYHGDPRAVSQATSHYGKSNQQYKAPRLK